MRGRLSSHDAARLLRRMRHPRVDSRIPESRNVIVRYASGRIEHGYTYDLDPRLPSFRLFTPEVICSRAVEVWVRDLKAVFFVRSLTGHHGGAGGERRDLDAPPEARKVRVSFRDGEVVMGYTTVCDRRRPGFFLVPDDPTGNIERVFAVFDAIDTVAFD
jgi:hypothetical protein